MHRKKIIYLVAFFAILIVLVVGVYVSLKKTNAQQMSNRLTAIAQVGDYSITAQDVKYKNAITQIYYPEEKRDLGLQLLIKSYTTAQILKNNGHEITESILATESARIDKNTLRPEMLAQIKAVFSGDERAYQQVYILPIYAERVLYYEFFLHDASIQAPAKQLAEEFLQSALKSPPGFEAIATKSSTKTASFTVSRSRGIEWSQSPKQTLKDLLPPTAANNAPADVQMKTSAGSNSKSISEEGQKWIQEVVNTLKPGQVFPKVIDRHDMWMVTRFVGISEEEKDAYHFVGAMFPKADFTAWETEEKKRVVIR